MAHLENVRRRSAQRFTDTGLKSNIKISNVGPWLSAVFILVALVTWELLARANLISVLFFPAPSTTLNTLVKLISSGKLAPHLWASLERLIIGFAIGGTIGMIVGLAMGWSNNLRAILDPIIAALHPMPKIAILPLIMIIFGLGETSKIVAIAIAAFFPILINSMAGVRQINPVYFEVTQNYGASRWKTLTRVVFPGSLPLILAGARLAINVAMVITIAIELVSAQEGLGVLIWFAWQTLRTEELYASLVITGLIGIIINFTLQKLSLYLAPWHVQKSNQQY